MLKNAVKPKLPRKRKKACIKAQGRKSYYDTVYLARVTGEHPCKFWVNSKVKRNSFELENNIPFVTIVPTEYW